jgi:hypothetical protein
MLIVGARKATPKKWIIVTVIGVLMLLNGPASLGALLTLHIRIRSSPAAPGGFRLFGFPRAKSK